MKPQQDILAQIERSLDGELSREEMAGLEAKMQENPALRDHMDSLSELRGLLRVRFDDAASGVDWNAMSSSVLSAIDQPARQADMEMLAMAWADGELHDPNDIAAVEQYLQAHPDAAAAAGGLSNLRDVTRMPFERAQESVNFEAISARVMRDIESEELAPAAGQHAEDDAVGAKRSVFAVMLDWLRAPGTGVAAFAGAAFAIAIVLPVLLKSNSSEQASTQTPIVNNYYMTPPEVESVRYEEGYWGAITQGDDMSAPVIWIQQDEPSAPSNRNEDGQVPDSSSNDRGI